MRLAMEVIDHRSGIARRVTVEAASEHRLADLTDALGAPGEPVWIGDGPVPRDAPIGLPPLMDGVTLEIARPIHARPHQARPHQARSHATTRVPVVELAVISGPDAGRRWPLAPGAHTVGRGESVTVRISDPAISRAHGTITVGRDGITWQELGVTNATDLDHTFPDGDGGSVTVRIGDRWRVGDTVLTLTPSRWSTRRLVSTGLGTWTAMPQPRVSPPSRPVTIGYPAMPTPARRRAIPWVMVALPVPFAVVLALLFGPRMLAFALLSPLMMLGSVLGDRSTSRREHREELQVWRERTHSCDRRLAAAMTAERAAREQTCPDPLATIDAARGRSARLWERRALDPDLLAVRVGVGVVDASIEVRERDGTTVHPPLARAPIGLDLAAIAVVGICGPDESVAGLARAMVGHAAVWQSPQVLSLTAVGGSTSWVRDFADLPHLRDDPDDPMSVRMAHHRHADTVLAPLRDLLLAYGTDSTDGAADPRSPTHLLLVDRPDRLRHSSAFTELMTLSRDHPLRILVTGGRPEDLPHETTVLVELDDSGRGHLTGAESRATGFVADGVGRWWAREATRHLAPLRDATPRTHGPGALPRSARLLDLLVPARGEAVEGSHPAPDAAWVRDRWSTPAGDLAVPIGVGSEGVVTLDLVAEGPHALVGGTTGSGKSEFLQTLVCSLALHHPPERVTFVLVDYKGGAAFARCAELPHTVGMLTDLEPDHVERALRSLTAELSRRERVLADLGAPDIDHPGARGALPRLILVIDEFRMMAEEQPEVLDRLLRIATIGRSLGVHLVLATQRPAGVVTADIKANVNLRIALRVRDPSDSLDVVGDEQAAHLPPSAPGRLVLGSSDGARAVVQAGRVGGAVTPSAPPHLTVTTLDLTGTRAAPGVSGTSEGSGTTDLDRLVDAITAAHHGRAAPHRPWTEPLPTRLEWADQLEVPDARADLLSAARTGAWGLLDVPEEQRRAPLLATASQSLLIIGSPGSGRTTALSSLIAASTDLDHALEFHLVGDLVALGSAACRPGVASAVAAEDRPTVRRLLATLRSMLDSRGEDTADRRPIMLVIDGWSRLVEQTSVADFDDFAGQVESLLRDGASRGLRVVVTGGRELLTGRWASLVTDRLVLHLPDRSDRALAGVPESLVPRELTVGRGIVMPARYACQIALPPGPLADTAGPSRRSAWTVTALPVLVARHQLAPVDGLRIGLGGRGEETVTWEPAADGRRLLITGAARSGRTAAAVHLALESRRAGAPTVFVGHPGDGSGALLSAGVEVLAHHDVDALVAARRAHDDLAVVVDDVDRVLGEPMEEALREIIRRVDRDAGLIAVSTSTQAASHQLRGVIAEVGRARCGVLLTPSGRADGDALGVRVPATTRTPGRGYLVRSGIAQEVQVAEPAS